MNHELKRDERQRNVPNTLTNSSSFRRREVSFSNNPELLAPGRRPSLHNSRNETFAAVSGAQGLRGDSSTFLDMIRPQPARGQRRLSILNMSRRGRSHSMSSTNMDVAQGGHSEDAKCKLSDEGSTSSLTSHDQYIPSDGDPRPMTIPKSTSRSNLDLSEHHLRRRSTTGASLIPDEVRKTLIADDDDEPSSRHSSLSHRRASNGVPMNKEKRNSFRSNTERRTSFKSSDEKRPSFSKMIERRLSFKSGTERRTSFKSGGERRTSFKSNSEKQAQPKLRSSSIANGTDAGVIQACLEAQEEDELNRNRSVHSPYRGSEARSSWKFLALPIPLTSPSESLNTVLQALRSGRLNRMKPLFYIFYLVTIAITYTSFYRSSSMNKDISQLAQDNEALMYQLNSLQGNILSNEDLVNKLREEMTDLYEENDKLKTRGGEADSFTAEEDQDLETIAENEELLNDLERVETSHDRLVNEMRTIVDKIQLESYRKVYERFGPGPHKVQFTVEIPGEGKGSFIVEMFSLERMPHSIHLFLEQVHYGLWNGNTFAVNSPRMLQTGDSGDVEKGLSKFENFGLSTLSFHEYHMSHPHEKWTVGFAGIGPNFFINKGDNKKHHGPGKKFNRDAELVPKEADPCFGMITEGRDTLEKLYAQPTRDEFNSFLDTPVRILEAVLLTEDVSSAEVPKNLSGKHFFDSAPALQDRRANLFIHDEVVECTIYEVKGLAVDGPNAGHQSFSSFECFDKSHDDALYAIDNIPPELDQTSIESGRTKLRVSDDDAFKNAKIDGFLHLESHHAQFRNPFSGRKLSISKRQGAQKLLIVRVTYRDGDFLEEPSHNASEISTSVFKNLQRYSTCSGNKLKFVPADKHGTGGVLDIELYENLSDMSWINAQKHVNDFLRKKYFIQWMTYDFVIHVYPRKVDFQGSGGIAYVNWYLSFFWDDQIMIKHTLLHELGHNFGHDHSGDNLGNVYNDQTGFMGRGDETPNVCFNAPKSYYFGWYADRQISIEPSKTFYNGKLVGVNDYLNGEISDTNSQVLIRITGVNETDIFLMFNRVEGINTGNPSIGDNVTVVSQEQDSRPSSLLSILGEGKQYNSSNWEGSGNDLVIKVCSISLFGRPSNAHVIIYIDDGTNGINCDTTVGFTDAPTQAPIESPLCEEKKWNKYVQRVQQNGKQLKKSCNWLRKMKIRKPKKTRWLCRRKGQGGNKAASEVCCSTCSDFI